METGAKISFVLHGILLYIVAFGGPLFDSEKDNAIQISEITILTNEEFEKLTVRAPVAQILESVLLSEASKPDSAPVPLVEQPVQEQPVPEIPQSPVAESIPDVTSVQAIAEPEVAVDISEVAFQEQDNSNSISDLPDAPARQADRSVQVAPEQLAASAAKPRPAPRIDTRAAPKPPTDAEKSKEVTESTALGQGGSEQVVEQQESAPEESTTEIVTEADSSAAAPSESLRPKQRPSGLAAVKQIERQAAKDRRDKIARGKAAAQQAERLALAKAIEDAVNKAAGKPSGPPLTSNERNSLVLDVQQCWNPPIGVRDAADLQVTLLINMKPDGRLDGSPKLIEPSGVQNGVVRQAFEAGRRALLRCAPYKLPKEKYERWRQIEVVFNPQKMVVR